MINKKINGLVQNNAKTLVMNLLNLRYWWRWEPCTHARTHVRLINATALKILFEHDHNQPIKIGQRCAGKLSILRHHTCIFPILVLSFLVFSSCLSAKNYARVFVKVRFTLLKMLGSIKIVLLLGVIYLCRAAEEDVLDLTDSDFASTLGQHDTALVMFYAPW